LNSDYEQLFFPENRRRPGLSGTTEYIGFPKVAEYGAGPIRLQSHGDKSAPIGFRNIWNIWLREL